MGQQQLLLLVLGMVIVGIAVVAGIQAFSEGKQKADRDAAISDAMRIISDVQAWKLKPKAFGGGDGLTDGFTSLKFKSLGIKTTGDAANKDADKYETMNGCFGLAGGQDKATLTVYLSDCSTTIATVDVADATVNGITWTYTS